MPNSTVVIRRSTLVLPPRRPLVMGILNVTPDSFSDGGDYFNDDDAIVRAQDMIAEGAAMIDVGGESTRPGSGSTPAEEQMRRVIPVIRAIRERNLDIPISIDTRSAAVAQAALDAGADIVNDVSALQDDPGMADVAAASGAAVVLMHRRGTSLDMQNGGGPHYDDVTAEIILFLRRRRAFAVDHGIDRSRIIFDPGLGFGKRVEHNVDILRQLDRFVALGQPVLVGASRKRFLGPALGADAPRQRLAGSLVCAVTAALRGAAILRVHDVCPTVDALELCLAEDHL